MNRKTLFAIFIALFITNVLLGGLLTFTTLVLTGAILTVLKKYSEEKEFPLYRVLFGIALSILFLLMKLAVILRLV